MNKHDKERTSDIVRNVGISGLITCLIVVSGNKTWTTQFTTQFISDLFYILK